MLRTGLLGYPIEHSLSPAIHNAAYAALGLDWEYALYPCKDTAAFLQMIANAREDSAHVVGFNVTTPYKVDAYEACVEHSPFAAATGNANVLTWDRGTGDGLGQGDGGRVPLGFVGHVPRPLSPCPSPVLRGDNTDGYGLVASLQREGGVSVAGSSVVLCGTGPVAMSALLALTEAHAASISVVTRDLEKGRKQLRRLNERLGLRQGVESDSPGQGDGARAPSPCHGPEFPALSAARLVSYGEVAACLETADILIDATSVGMSPSDGTVVPLEALRPKTTVLDVVYGHGETALLRGARDINATAIDGLGMLIEQAALTIELWARARGIQVEAPRALMRQAALTRR
jgi:shikimate dehydrogenase